MAEGPPAGMRYEPVATDARAIAACAKVLSRTFHRAGFFTDAYVRWQYAENPAGPIVGFNALLCDGTIAAHYVCQPFSAEIDGIRRRGLLSLNTATHPEHQGKGLFTALASATYDAARNAGYDFVVGVANANSTPGFVRKLGFQLVAPLLARVGIGALRLNDDAGAPRYRRVWSEDEIAWRLRSPRARYRCSNGRIYASTDMPLTDAAIGYVPNLRPQHGPHGFAHLWIGLDQRVTRARNPLYVDIPRRLRPSPLNFIYKPLSATVPLELRAEELEFWAIDFDAY